MESEKLMPMTTSEPTEEILRICERCGEPYIGTGYICDACDSELHQEEDDYYGRTVYWE